MTTQDDHPVDHSEGPSGRPLTVGQTSENDAEGAETALRHASWLDVHDAESLNLIAAMKVRQNRLDAACEIQRRAVARQPDQPRQYILLSDILERMGRSDEARAAQARVSELSALARTQRGIN